jgi:hypothetical protein
MCTLRHMPSRRCQSYFSRATVRQLTIVWVCEAYESCKAFHLNESLGGQRAEILEILGTVQNVLVDGTRLVEMEMRWKGVEHVFVFSRQQRYEGFAHRISLSCLQ